MSLFAVENSKESTKTSRANDYSKVAVFKANIQKSGVFLYTSNEQLELEIKKHNTIYISIHKKKCLDVNLTKYVQNLCEENYKTLRKEIEEYINQ